MRNKENGITLIALVITIILLTILAGVTLVMVSGDSSIFKKAGEAAEGWEDATQKELNGLNEVEKLLEQYGQ